MERWRNWKIEIQFEFTVSIHIWNWEKFAIENIGGNSNLNSYSNVKRCVNNNFFVGHKLATEDTKSFSFEWRACAHNRSIFVCCSFLLVIANIYCFIWQSFPKGLFFENEIFPPCENWKMYRNLIFIENECSDFAIVCDEFSNCNSFVFCSQFSFYFCLFRCQSTILCAILLSIVLPSSMRSHTDKKIKHMRNNGRFGSIKLKVFVSVRTVFDRCEQYKNTKKSK